VTLADDNKSSFIVGDRGQVFLSGMREQGAIIVTWGRESRQQCRADFSLPKQSTYAGITEVSASCHQER